MSLFGAMSTAISGLTAQSASFGNISDNIANSQTVGFKGTGTSFEDLLTSSSATDNQPGAVLARPDYQNDVQGSISQSKNPLAMAISGQGFFPISLPAAGQIGTANFAAQQYYTRAGDFAVNASGYLVNSDGGYLNGWPINPATGAADQTKLAPVQITQSLYNPIPTSTITLAANLPATPVVGTPITSVVSVYDTLGTSHVLTLNWTQSAQNVWTVAATSPDDITAPALGSATVKFGAVASGSPVPDGAVGSISGGTGTLSGSAFVAGQPATLTLTSNFGNGPQAINVNMGVFGQATGITQYAGTAYSLQSLSQNGAPQGSFTSVSVSSGGDIQVNYDNGQVRKIAQIPITVFADPNALQRQNGSKFTATLASGAPLNDSAGANGAGTLQVGALEGSNVDIATQFSSLIVTQQAYSANAKIITTAEQLLQTTLSMKQ